MTILSKWRSKTLFTNKLNTRTDISGKVDRLVIDVATHSSPVGVGAVPLLVAASNKHVSNAAKMGRIVNNLLLRIRKVEEISASVTGIQATLESYHRTLQVVLGRTSANAGTAPAAFSIDDAAVVASTVSAGETSLRAIVEEVINGNGKRVREESVLVIPCCDCHSCNISSQPGPAIRHVYPQAYTSMVRTGSLLQALKTVNFGYKSNFVVDYNILLCDQDERYGLCIPKQQQREILRTFEHCIKTAHQPQFRKFCRPHVIVHPM